MTMISRIACLLLCFFIIHTTIIPVDVKQYDNQSWKFRPTQDSDGPTISLDAQSTWNVIVDASDDDGIWLDLKIRVNDSDGVKSVIGSYRRVHEALWTNVSMELNPQYVDLYEVHATNFTFGNEIAIYWEIKFYACDMLDKWNSAGPIEVVYERGFTLNSIMPPFTVFIGTVAILFLYIRRTTRERRGSTPE